jgi:chromosomal replication initiation ATPase DnaA
VNSVADIWKIVLSRLSQDLSETTISTWFDEVEAVSIKDRTLYLHCPNDFKRSTIEDLLTTYFKRYFNKVEVSVYIYDTDDFHRGELVLVGEVTDEFGEKAQIHEVMTKKGSVVRSFLDYQNLEN